MLTGSRAASIGTGRWKAGGDSRAIGIALSHGSEGDLACALRERADALALPDEQAPLTLSGPGGSEGAVSRGELAGAGFLCYIPRGGAEA
jgi:hypothetical protein